MEDDPSLSVIKIVDTIYSSYNIPTNINFDFDLSVLTTPDGISNSANLPAWLEIKIPKKYLRLGIRINEKAPEFIIKEGIHIFSRSRRVSHALAELIKKFPKL